jgi:hypothetical protein
VLVLIGLILLGIAILAVVSVALWRSRQPATGESALGLSSEGGEREVYDRLYGRQSTTVSAGVPIERSPGADLETPEASLSE